MRPASRFLPVLLIALAAAACTGEPITNPPPQGEISPEARAYLDSALNIMQSHSLRRHAIEWPAFREQMMGFAAGAREPRHTYSTIRYALEQLGDRHSLFLTPAEYAAAGFSTAPQGQMLDGTVGYLRVPGYSGASPDAHAQQYHDLLRLLDRPATCGWIVDVRNNTGGNMWPMLAGLGPLLGTDRPGAFVDADGARMQWTYDGGVAGTEPGGSVVRVGRPHTLSRADPPVALLVNGSTVSAGEAVVVAFRGRPNARTFGSATYGVPTGNQGFPMPDTAMVVLTVVRMADRAGTAYDAPLQPDEEHLGYLYPLPDDALAQRALQWVRAQPACAQ